MSRKTPQFTGRPSPPCIENILDDVKKAPDDDIAFSPWENVDSKDPTATMGLMQESFHEASSPRQPGDVDDPSEEHTKHIDTVYKKAVVFLRTCDELRGVPETLQEQSEHLQTLAEEINKNIEDLKNQSQAVLQR